MWQSEISPELAGATPSPPDLPKVHQSSQSPAEQPRASIHIKHSAAEGILTPVGAQASEQQTSTLKGPRTPQSPPEPTRAPQIPPESHPKPPEHRASRSIPEQAFTSNILQLKGFWGPGYPRLQEQQALNLKAPRTTQGPQTPDPIRPHQNPPDIPPEPARATPPPPDLPKAHQSFPEPRRATQSKHSHQTFCS